jgi:hypothetical protein
VHAAQTDLAVGQKRVANLMRHWPQDEHQTIYAISLLKHDVVVLRKSEGPQKWLATCSADMHRDAHTIDVCILEKANENDNVKWGIKSTKHGKFGRNICLFT